MRTSRIKDALPADINASKYAVEIVGFGSEFGGGGRCFAAFCFLLHFRRKSRANPLSEKN